MPGGRRNPLSMTNILGKIDGVVRPQQPQPTPNPIEALFKGSNFFNLTIEFIGARDLPKLDVIGSADPYFVANIDNAVSFVSTVIPNELNPVWNEHWRVRHVPENAVMTVEVWDKDEDRPHDDYIGSFKVENLIQAADWGEVTYQIQSQGPIKRKCDFQLKITCTPCQTSKEVMDAKYLFDGPIRFSKHNSPFVGHLTNLDQARLYSTWKIFLRQVPKFFTNVQVQSWNKDYKSAQTIFGSTPTSFAVKQGIMMGHKMLYARTARNGFGTIERREDLMKLFTGGSVGSAAKSCAGGGCGHGRQASTDSGVMPTGVEGAGVHHSHAPPPPPGAAPGFPEPDFNPRSSSLQFEHPMPSHLQPPGMYISSPASLPRAGSFTDGQYVSSPLAMPTPAPPPDPYTHPSHPVPPQPQPIQDPASLSPRLPPRKRKSLSPAPTPFSHRIKPTVYTYILSSNDNSFRFSETGAAFFVDYASKHALHANCADNVRYAGEFHLRPVVEGFWDGFSDAIADEDVLWQLVIDNNSGTYAPDGTLLDNLKALLDFNFGPLGLEVVVYDHSNPELKTSRDACRRYAMEKRGVGAEEFEPPQPSRKAAEGDTLASGASRALGGVWRNASGQVAGLAQSFKSLQVGRA